MLDINCDLTIQIFISPYSSINLSCRGWSGSGANVPWSSRTSPRSFACSSTFPAKHSTKLYSLGLEAQNSRVKNAFLHQGMSNEHVVVDQLSSRLAATDQPKAWKLTLRCEASHSLTLDTSIGALFTT